MSFNSGGVTLTGQFDLKSKQPIDGRYVIVSKSELIALLTTALYPGLEFTLTLSAEAAGITQVTLTAADSATYAGDYKIGTYKVKPDGINIMRIYDETNNTLDPDGQTVVGKVSNKVTVYEADADTTVDGIDNGVNTGDIAIIKNYVNVEFTPSGAATSIPEHLTYSCYVWDGVARKWEAADGCYNANNVYMSSDITLAGEYTQFGNLTKESKNATKTYSCKGRSLDYILRDILCKTEPATVTQPRYSFSATYTTDTGTTEIGSYITKIKANGSFSNGVYSRGRVHKTSGTYDTVTSADCTPSYSTSYEAKVKIEENFESGEVGTSSDSEKTLNNRIQITTTSSKDYVKLTSTCSWTDSPYYPANNMKEQDTTNEAISASSSTKEDTISITGRRYTFYGVYANNTDGENSSSIRGLTPTTNSSFTVYLTSTTKRVVIAAYGKTLNKVLDSNDSNANIVGSFECKSVPVEGANGYTAVDYNVYVLDFAESYGTSNSYSVELS